MRVHIDPDRCQGCGICEAHAPEIFSVTDDGVAVVLQEIVPLQFEDAVRIAVEDCPTESVQIS